LSSAMFAASAVGPMLSKTASLRPRGLTQRWSASRSPRNQLRLGLHQVMVLTKLLAGFIVTASPESGDKQTRAEPYAAQVNNGHVTMLEGDWNASYREELRSFPYGKFDDVVDASSRAFMTLAETKRPMRIAPNILARA
jgi:predicted phage terminase large subunit-like protein